MLNKHSAGAIGLVALLAGGSAAVAQLSTFAVLGGSTVTNTGNLTVVTGDLGVSPGSAVTGFPPGTVTGTIHAANAVSAQAQLELTNVFTNLRDAPCTTNLTGQDLGTVGPLLPGVYCFSTSAQLTGALILDAQGDPNAVFIFQIGSTLTTASASSVQVINGGSTCGVFFQVGSSATLGTTTSFQGNIVAQASITLNTGASLNGRALARIGAVTLDNSPVNICTGGVTLPITAEIPTLSQWAMVVLAGVLAMFGLIALRRGA